jgi:protein-S-isoprenylcysteine O-methyltransferase
MTGLRMLSWFALALAVMFVELRWGRRRPDASAEARQTDHLMMLATTLALVGGPVAAVTFRGSAVDLGPWSVALGVAVGALGLWLRSYAMRTLGRHYTLTPTVLHDHVLVSTGPYRRVRHPGYTGIVLQLVGLALCLGSLPALAFVLPVVLALPLRVRVEERLLAEEFGRSYEQYCQWTPHRFIAGVI